MRCAAQHPAPSEARPPPENNNKSNEDEDEEDEDDEDEFDDGIRRSYLPSRLAAATGQPEPIQVRLNEGYFAAERRALRHALANARQKLNSLHMLNPAKNETIRQQQEEWSEKEKYTLDSLNEIRVPMDERFQWNRPEDGREVWPSKLQYLLAITSYSIGLGNVIRFPILVQKNGGLAFIIPFVIMLLIEGIPLFYLELAIGQRMRKGAISCWNLVSPFVAGIGLASASVSFVIGLYYNTMVSWTLLYLFAAVTRRPLPFGECPAPAEEEAAEDAALGDLAASSNRSAGAAITEAGECQLAGPYEYFWFRETLNVSADVGTWTNFNWPILFCLLTAWLISYLCLARGLSSSKLLVYVASTFPYVILVVFFFKAISLDGWKDGVAYLFAPQWAKLLDPFVWLQAAGQVFFSLGLGFGGLIALSSYNPVNNNCHKDAVKVSLINFCASIFAGVVVFSILGFKANLSHKSCTLEREQQIDFYLSDYNLKALDYGAVFKQVTNNEDPSDTSQNKERKTKEEESSLKVGEFVASAANQTERNQTRQGQEDQVSIEDQNDDDDDSNDSDDEEYNSEDAIASILNLDRQLDSGSPTGSFDYGDSDTEFIINASNLISEEDLAKLIENIPNLKKCSLQSELDAATKGNGLVFVVIAEAITNFGDSSSTWAIVFFLMLLTLGLDSQFGNLEGLLSSLTDLNLINSIGRKYIAGLICTVSLAISVVTFSHGAGSYMFAIFDEYAGSFSLVLIALFELLAISYVYGLKRFCDDCELMTGKRPSFTILLSWRYVSPILLMIIIFATIRQFSIELTYESWSNGQVIVRNWPTWCILLGAFLICVCVIWIPVVAILSIFKIYLVPEEHLSHCWFPAEELREFHSIQDEHKITQVDRILFGFTHEDD